MILGHFRRRARCRSRLGPKGVGGHVHGRRAARGSRCGRSCSSRGAERVLVEAASRMPACATSTSVRTTRGPPQPCDAPRVGRALRRRPLRAPARRARRGPRLSVGAVSHWVLDFFVHGPDLPLWPGGPKVGLGAWSSLPLTLVLELLVFVPSVVVYARATKAKDRIGSWGFAAYVATLVLLYAGALFGPAADGSTRWRGPPPRRS